jgi:predicted ArsR family transcriptional regulator
MQAGKNKSFTFTLGLEIDTMKAGQPYQSPRQRVWTAIRKNREEFTIQQVADHGQMKYESAREFVNCLTKAGIVEVTSSTPLHHENCVVKQKFFKLVHDLGFNVPAVSKTGEIQSKQTGTKAMWNTLRITKKAMNYVELAKLSSNDELQITELTAREYLRFLYDAGYLRITQASNTAGKGEKRKYQLLPDMNTGPNPPQIQRAKQVFDPNTNQVMFTERPELEEEIKHGTLLHDQEATNDEY